MTDPEPQPADELGLSPEEEQLGQLVNEFFDRRQSGENLTEEAFIAQHPEHAEALREHLSGLGLLADLGSSREGLTRSQAVPLTPGGSSADASHPSSAQPLPNIPGYQVLKQVGRGGMGVVFKAIQLSTKRVVALKVLLEGPFASEASRRRFEREITLAAQLRHSNIIPIYDSGVADGRMYFAMEFVYGLPLSDYFRAHGTGVDGKLNLFAKIGDAVGHAHVRGVVHRDLKPSNILVDSEGEPHVLDFGLAKANASADFAASITAQIVGTPAYMSPEQASGDPSGVDTRTDVYSMGVMLYEALTGKMPYDTGGAIGKTLSNIADADPLHPSKANPKVRSELATIILKALEKKKEKRYQSVDALCSDIRHYLAGEPISARSPSGFYLLRKGVQKYRIAISVVLLMAISASAVGLMFHSLRKSRGQIESARAQQRQLEEEVSRQQAAWQQAEVARRDAEEARRIAEARQREYEWWVKQVDPEMAKSIDPLVRAFGKSIGPTDPTLATLQAAAELLAQREVPEGGMTKKPLDPNVEIMPPLVSRRPSWVKDSDADKPAEAPDSAAAQRRQELQSRLLEVWTQRLLSGPPVPPPTTESATSRPMQEAPSPAESQGGHAASQPTEPSQFQSEARVDAPPARAVRSSEASRGSRLPSPTLGAMALLFALVGQFSS